MSLHGPINPPSADEEAVDLPFFDFGDEPEDPEDPPFLEYSGGPQPTIQALQDAVNEHTKAHGYAVSRAQGKKNKKGEYRRYRFYCDRGRFTESRAIVRKASTRKTACGYQATAKLTDEGWVFYPHEDPSRREHNHPPSLDPSAHPAHRKVTSPVKRVIKQLSSSYAIKTRETATILRQEFPGKHFTRKDIHNQRAYLRAEEMDGYSASAAVIRAFEEEDVPYEAIWRGEDNEILEGIIFSFPETQDVWKRFGNCLGLDNTYATNVLNFPLMVVTTMTNINTVANVAFALMKDESRESFDALFQGLEKIREKVGAPSPSVVITDKDEQQRDALLEVWPAAQQQLCRYHMNANVGLRAKQKWVYPPEAATPDGVEDQEQADRA